MFIDDGYSIEEYPNENKIVIGIPALPETVNSTYDMTGYRKKQLSDDALQVILTVVKQFYADVRR